MYKTVRHGENSLQYTILPQTEEVLSNSGLKGKGRDYSPSIHVRRARRRSNLKYILVLAIGLIFATALACVPFYVLNKKLIDIWIKAPFESSSAAPTTAPDQALAGMAKSRKKELIITPESITFVESKPDASTSTTTYATSTVTIPTVSTATGEKSTTPPWIMPALRSWKSSSTIQTIPTEGNELPPLVKSNKKELTDVDNMSIKPWEKDIIIRPTVTPETIIKPNNLGSVIKYNSQSFIVSEKPVAASTKVFDDVLITTKAPATVTPVTTEATEQSKMKDLKDAMLSVDDDDDFKESLEVDEVFSLPPLKPEFPISDSDEVTVSKTASGWYGARWPFVDTSSYFQWTGYSPGDNLLLPLLVAALSSISLVLLLALAVRRRKRTYSAAAQAGGSELQTDDNTNLLTAENGDDAEE